MSERWIALLGTKGGPAIRPGSSMPTSLLLRMGGKTVLIDAGLGAARGVVDQGVALTGIDLIVVTHLHSDHYLELGPLLHTAWTAGLSRPVPVIGPAGLDDYWRHFLASMEADISLRERDEGRVPLAGLTEISELHEGVALDGSCKIEAIRNHHPPLKDSYALAISDGDIRIVFSGDTAPFDGWQAFCDGADLLIHEAMLPAGIDEVIRRTPTGDDRLRQHILRSHTDATQVGRLAKAANVGALVLTHLVPQGLPGTGPKDWEAAIRQHWDGPLKLAEDGMRFDL